MKSNVNFHIHTTYSDGEKTVAEIVEGLKKADVKHFSITDHDQVRGNLEAALLAKQYGLNHYNGVELSCCFNGEAGLDETSVCHIVGLNFNLRKMQAVLLKISQEKRKKMHELFCELIKDGYVLNLRNVEDENSNTKERKNIAKELIRQKYAIDADEAFTKILNSDRYKKYAKNVPTIKEGIEIIHQSGGLAVWAHPFGIARGGKKDLWKEQVMEIAQKMKEYNLDGLEVFYQHYISEQIDFLDQLAKRHDFKKSIGTDYHGVPSEKVDDPAYASKLYEQLFFEKDGINPIVTII